MMPPLGRRAEEALLGAVLLRPQQLPGLRWIHPQTLALPGHQELWRLLHTMDPATISPLTVHQALRELSEQRDQDRDLPSGVALHALPPHRLSALADACPDPRRGALYGGMVLDAAIHRAVDETGGQLRQLATADVASPAEARTVLDQTQHSRRRLERLGDSWRAVPETVRTILDTPMDRKISLAERRTAARQDLRAEATTIASLLSQPDQLPHVGWLQPGDFADRRNRTTYQAMTALADRHAPIDPLTVAWQAARLPGARHSDHELAELTRTGLPCRAEHAGTQVLTTAALDRLDAAGHRIRQAARVPAIAAPVLLTEAEAAIAPTGRDHQRLQAIEHDHQREHHGASEQEPAPATYDTDPEEIDL
ncbi:DnaB-like helicase N-terminal domain-containing protein [Streptomyces sp. G-5]|uniref:DnaB-like helicase N-terminal domain-containing protein n=1 Tax=Streptomyces sp. G-5 TaxID=2977231 RepID=UPI0021CF28BC|nr:DnaB-like helicase N-terminal domain-containing protein [Streptomyces sp. G-5]MCU4750292.1 DNA helicase [Streptomyces sp. G-5]